MENYMTKLLGLKDVIVTDIDDSGSELLIYIELPRRKHKCPMCGTSTDKIHDYRKQKVKDSKVRGKPTCLILKKRRYVCPNCSKRFYETNTFVPKYYRTTQRAVIEIIQSFRETVSATHIAKEHNLSVSTVLRYFDLISFGKYKLPRVLSVDEFKGNAGGEKFQTIVTDAENHIVLDVLPNRKACDLTKYFLSFPRSERLKVEYLVMDMSTLFYNALKDCFPNAKLVIDRYHITRQSLWALENVRKNEQKKLSPAWRKQWKRSRYLLNRNPEKLKEDEQQKLRVILGMSSRIETAYYLKNEFIEILRSDDPVEAKKRLGNWNYIATTSDVPEFNDCARAVTNWNTGIINAVAYPYSNGFTEGCNNKTKVLKRACYGVSNFERFRNRIIYCSYNN